MIIVLEYSYRVETQNAKSHDIMCIAICQRRLEGSNQVITCGHDWQFLSIQQFQT